MDFRITRVKQLFPMILVITFLLCSVGCGLQSTLKPDAPPVEPQSGRWVANFSLKNDYGNTENWVLNFFVDEDGKTVSSLMLGHYQGDVSTMKVIFSPERYTMENNSFELSLPEFRSNINYTYEGSIAFVSETEANGVLNIYKKDRKFSVARSTLEEPTNEQVD